MTATGVLKFHDFEEFKALGLMVEDSPNDVAHYATVQELDFKVKHCEAGMLLTPTICFKYPWQVLVVQHYEDFKNSLSHVYC